MEFFQDWMKAASSALPNMGAAAAPGTSAWAMPTLDPEELDKRIQELKTVQFWLEQNGRMIGMTIQTLEVQRMTLQTLRGMKVPVDALRESLKVKPMAPSAPPAKAPSAAPEADDQQAEAATDDPAGGVNPVAWWGTLTEQFTHLASQAVQAGQEAMSGMQVAPPAEGTESTGGTDAEPSPAKAKPAPRARKTAASAAAPAKAARKTPKR
jgi:hypothetical protein